jgi:D-alanine transaminase
MSSYRVSYVNGRYVHHDAAYVHIEDRGYQFSDGIYEVMAIQQGVLMDEEAHLKRLARSLRELQITFAVSDNALLVIIHELLRRNRMRDGIVYLQVTRGVAKRDHPFPEKAYPALVITLNPPKFPSEALLSEGCKVITHPDLRWERRDIKSISLLPNILAKQKAKEAKAREAWLINKDGMVVEGSSSNAYIVHADTIFTHPENEAILGGITRKVTLALAREAGLAVKEEVFSLKDALAAEEAFLTSTTNRVMPIVQIDDKTIGAGTPGPMTQKLITLYGEHEQRYITKHRKS